MFSGLRLLEKAARKVCGGHNTIHKDNTTVVLILFIRNNTTVGIIRIAMTTIKNDSNENNNY